MLVITAGKGKGWPWLLPPLGLHQPLLWHFGAAPLQKLLCCHPLWWLVRGPKLFLSPLCRIPSLAVLQLSQNSSSDFSSTQCSETELIKVENLVQKIAQPLTFNIFWVWSCSVDFLDVHRSDHMVRAELCKIEDTIPFQTSFALVAFWHYI